MENPLKKFRFGLRFLAVFWRKHRPLISLGVAIGVLSFLSFPRLSRSLFPENTQKIGFVGKFTPAELPLEIQRLISDGLTSTQADGEVVPALAASWEVNQEGKEYLFILREDIFWQTGKPVLAEDITYYFNDVTFKVIDKKKIKFELKESFTPFPAVVSRPVFQKGLVGTGEYKVKSMKKNGQIIETITLKPAKNKSKPILIYRFYPTERAARTGFKLGEIDILKELSDPKDLKDWGQVEQKAEVKYNRFSGLFFDTQSEKLADKSIRQALAYAINKHWEPRAFSPISPDSWAYNSQVKPYHFDLEKAKELLEKAGEGNEGSSLEEIELATIPSLLPVAEEIKVNWENLGIKVRIKIISSLSEPFETLLVFQEIPPDPDQYLLWHSTQTANISRYKSPKLDKLLEDGRKTLDQEKRKELYQDFQRFLVEDTPTVFLFHPTVYTLSRKYR